MLRGTEESMKLTRKNRRNSPFRACKRTKSDQVSPEIGTQGSEETEIISDGARMRKETSQEA